MDINQRQEQFANAFLVSVAAVAGFAASKPDVDDDSVDWTISSRLSRRPKIDIQMKSRRDQETASADVIPYDLKRKNFDDLILTDLLSPRLLVLVVVPEEIDYWLDVTPERLVLRHCAYWISLAGQSPTNNSSKVRINIPRTNQLTVTSLQALMHRANEQVPL